MSISFVNITKTAFFSKPYMVAGDEASVELITFSLVLYMTFILPHTKDVSD